MAQKQYSIGELSKLCNVSRKALRFYDSIGLISSTRHDCNNYRVYTQDDLLHVLVLKYYKQMGFRLEEMRTLISGQGGNVCTDLRAAFERKLGELRQAQVELRRCEESVHDWHRLITEAETVISQGVCEVGVKYVEPMRLICQRQQYDGSAIRQTVINMSFMHYVEQTGNAITGPVMIRFSSLRDRLGGEPQTIHMMQNFLSPRRECDVIDFGGCIMASCYHVGPQDDIGRTYGRLIAWAKNNGYLTERGCCERCVVDYWTTSNEALHVTEVLVRVTRDPARVDRGVEVVREHGTSSRG